MLYFQHPDYNESHNLVSRILEHKLSLYFCNKKRNHKSQKAKSTKKYSIQLGWYLIPFFYVMLISTNSIVTLAMVPSL